MIIIIKNFYFWSLDLKSALGLFYLVFFLSLVTNEGFASGCYSTYLDGTKPGFGRVPLYSSALLASSSLLLKTESGSDDKDKQSAYNAGFVVSGAYFYVAMHGICRSVNKKEYEKLWSKRSKLLAEGRNEDELPFELRWLVPMSSKNELDQAIHEWKSYQKKLLFIVGGINSALLFENAQNADTDGVKYFSYLSIAAILGIAVFDVDNLWNEKPPFWAKFDVLVSTNNGRVTPGLSYSYTF